MKAFFYPRLAAQNIRKNGTFYLPYLFTVAGCAAAFYILCALGGQEMPNRLRFAYLESFMFIGLFVLGLFSVIFLVYTNSFLMKRRTRELGLYNVLGMDKGNLAHMLLWETVFLAVSGIGGGLLLGALLQRLTMLFLMRMMKFDILFEPKLSPQAMLVTALVFAAILGFTLLLNLWHMVRQSAVELLHSGNRGEREPKTRWVLTILGLATLGAGYSLALTLNDAMAALLYYFLAVVLVIVGTYCLFTAVSVFCLKLLRKNKGYYYKTNHFISLSGMLHRMKRNGVGLANICILSTMVLVMVSGTLSLYLGTEDSILESYPQDVRVQVNVFSEKRFALDGAELAEQFLSLARQRGYTPQNVSSCGWLEVTFGSREAGEYTTYKADSEVFQYCVFAFMSQQDYCSISGAQAVPLAQGEALLCGGQTDAAGGLTLQFANCNTGEPYRTLSVQVVGTVEQMPSIGNLMAYTAPVYYLILPTQEDVMELFEFQAKAYASARSSYDWQLSFDVDATAEEKQALCQELSGLEPGLAQQLGDTDACGVRVYNREEVREEFYSLNGGFFFLGVFLGLIFLMATVLNIYYKQISEGYEDRERFAIMQKVGLKKSEIRRSINGQVLVMFFAPLAVAALHTLVDLPLVILLLTLFGMHNALLTLFCTLATVGVFAAVYLAVYLVTARTYYRIVSECSCAIK